MHIPYRLGTSHIFGHCIGTRHIEDAQGSYSHEDEVRGLCVSMGNVETESSGHRDRVEPVALVETMQSLHKEVPSYRVYNERMIRVQEEMLQSLNMMQKQVNKNSGTKQASGARQATTSKSHDRRIDNVGYRQLSSVNRHHRQSPGHSSRRAHAHSRSESGPSVTPVRNQRRRESDILQGELRKLKPPSFDGEHRKKKRLKPSCWE